MGIKYLGDSDCSIVGYIKSDSCLRRTVIRDEIASFKIPALQGFSSETAWEAVI